MSEIVKTEYEDKVEYTLNGELHREDGPAREYSNGDKYWYLHGKLHRENGPAVEYSNGYKSWYLYGKRHRENGPAIEWLYGKSYFVDGKILDFITSDQMLVYYIKYGFLK